jgi:hypothetical protein
MAAGKASKRATPRKAGASAAAAKGAAQSWDDAERDYADLTVKVADIAARLGLTRAQLMSEVKKRGWTLRSALKPATGTGGGTDKADAAPKPTLLLQHVYKTIAGELSKLDDHKGASSQDRERASRALSQMVNSLEKAVEMQREMIKDKAKGSTAKDKEQLAHAEILRRSIAERIERLNGKRDAGKRAGDAE